MEKQLSEFAANKLRPIYENLNSQHIFLLPMGNQACSNLELFTRQLCDIWRLSDMDISVCGFSAEDKDYGFDVCAVDDPRDWDWDQIAHINEEVDFQVGRFLQQWHPDNILFGFVWADDPLVSKASDLLTLFHEWIRLNGGKVSRCILSVILPRWNSIPADRVPGAFAVLEKIRSKTTDPVMCMHYTSPDSPLSSPNWAMGAETYFFESTLQDPLRCLEDAALMLGSTERGGMFLPAFRQTGLAYQNVMIQQILSCMSQLEKKSDDRPSASLRNMPEMIHEYVTSAEGSKEDFTKWMYHARVFLHNPMDADMDLPDLYGPWFENLAQEWCDRLLEKEYPEAMLQDWLRNYSLSQLEEFRNQLQKHSKQTLGRTLRGSSGSEHRSWSDWTQYLEQRIQEDLPRLYHNATENRTQLLVQHMLTLISSRLRDNTAPKMDWSSLRRNFERVRRRSLQHVPYTCAVMNEDQAIRFTQQLQQLISNPNPNYQNLFTFIDELIHEAIHTDLIAWLKTASMIAPCSLHDYQMDLSTAYTECPQVIPGGRRSGQVLYLLRLNQKSSIADTNLLFYANNRQLLTI